MRGALSLTLFCLKSRALKPCLRWIIASRVTSKTSSILLCPGLIRLSCSDFLFTPWLRGHTLRRPYTRLHASVRFLILADKTKLRSSLSPDMVSASVIFVAGESIKKMSTEEIMAQYQSKRKLEDEGAAEMRLLNLPLRRRSNGGLSVSCKSISPFPLFFPFATSRPDT